MLDVKHVKEREVKQGKVRFLSRLEKRHKVPSEEEGAGEEDAKENMLQTQRIRGKR